MTADLIPPGAAEFAEKFHQFRYSAFRLETLQSYGNSAEDADFEAFVAGRPRPKNPGHEQWQAMVRATVHAGRIIQRVHVVTEPLSQYMRLELTWGYGLNAAAGEASASCLCVRASYGQRTCRRALTTGCSTLLSSTSRITTLVGCGWVPRS